MGAGCKAVVVDVNEDGTDEAKFSHALVTGICRYPKRVGKRMAKKKIAKRIASMKCFVKYMNVNHMMPTRYSVNQNLDVKQMFKEDLKNTNGKHLSLETRTKLAKQVRTHFMEKYQEPQSEGHLDF